MEMQRASPASSYAMPARERPEKKRLQPQSRAEQARTELGVSERILALLLGTPEDLSNDLLSNLGGIDRTSPAFALGVLHILGDVKLGAEKARLDQEVSLESWVHDSNSGGVARRSTESKGRVNRGIREVNVERGIAGEGVDEEYATGTLFSGSEERDVTVDRAVRSLDKELGEIRNFGRCGVICESDVDGDGRVLGLEHQEFTGGEVSDNNVILGSKLATVNAQSL